MHKSYRSFDLSQRFAPASRRWMLEAFAKNATNEKIKTAAGNFITAEGFTPIYLPPSTYGLSIGYAFGD